MAYKSSIFLSLTLFFLVLFGISSAQLEQQQSWGSQGHVWGASRQQGHRLQAKTECRINRLTSQQPSQRLQSEAGEVQLFDKNSPEFVCAGVEVVRIVIRPRGLLLPGYVNAPQLVYVEQGNI